MKVLVDSSIWIGYFRSGEQGDILDTLIDENLIVTNNLILTELVPFLEVQNQRKLITLLQTIEKLSLTIDWDGLIGMQTLALKNGLNGVGIPDLIVAQNAIHHKAYIFSEDKHFALLTDVTELKFYPAS
jgi:predicted nucleic acid-binding protein